MDLSRRDFNKLGLTALGWPLLAPSRAAAAPAPAAVCEDRIWNAGWRFHLGDAAAQLPGYDDRGWALVDLPHGGHEEPFAASRTYQGLCWYRKRLEPDARLRGADKVWFTCEGAMQVADVWVNGVHRLRHAGGYLPFSVDISDALREAGHAVLALRLDNRDDPAVPPGKPQAELDFCYFGGIYRNVGLRLRQSLFITDPVAENAVAAGGVFCRCLRVSARQAELEVEVHVRNAGSQAALFDVVALLRRDDGRPVAGQAAGGVACAPGQAVSTRLRLLVEEPAMWSPEAPHLHVLEVRLVQAGRVVDQARQRVGIRWLETDPQRGFFLNGRHRVPYGANRHQAYPYVGNALSDRAQYREAKKLKAAGFDLIRLSHYPQASAFLDACDELGMMVIECLPGWQHFQDTDAFKGAVEQDLRDLIRRDRHHACATLWETSLNETPGHDAFLRHLVEVAHQEYPGSQMLTCGDTEGHDYDAIRYEVPYSGWDDATHSRPSRAHGAMSLHREYGDNQFGAYSRYRRGDGEALMRVQAWNYQTALNQQLRLPHTWGQCVWEAVDNNRGMSPQIATCGALDLFRLPKFLYYFLQSQRDPRVRSRLFDSGPMVYIAHYWTPASPPEVVVFANTDEVALMVNGREVRRQRPDLGPDVAFGDDSGFDLNYWLHHGGTPRDQRKREVRQPVYGGGNCTALAHPPFTFKGIGFEPGELRAVAYLDGLPAASHARRTPGAPAGLALGADLEGLALAADGADLVFVHATVVDAQGTPVPQAELPVRFAVAGPAALVGEQELAAEAGIASTLLRASGVAGQVRVAAEAPGLPAATLQLRAIRPARRAAVPSGAA